MHGFTAGRRNSEEIFRVLVAAYGQTVWTADAEGKVVEDSPSWRAFTGQSAVEGQGEAWLDAVHPDDRTAESEVDPDGVGDALRQTMSRHQG